MEDWLLLTVRDFIDVVVLCTFTNTVKHQQLQQLRLAEARSLGAPCQDRRYSTTWQARYGLPVTVQIIAPSPLSYTPRQGRTLCLVGLSGLRPL